MSWSTFFTIVAQAVIVLTIGFIVSAAFAGIRDAINSKKEK